MFHDKFKAEIEKKSQTHAKELKAAQEEVMQLENCTLVLPRRVGGISNEVERKVDPCKNRSGLFYCRSCQNEEGPGTKVPGFWAVRSNWGQNWSGHEGIRKNLATCWAEETGSMKAIAA